MTIAEGAHRYHLPILRPLYASLAEPSHLLMRLAAGGLLIPHGWPKLFGDRAGFVGFFGSLGLQPAEFFVLAVGFGEVVGGVLLMLGLFTRIAAGYTTVIMLSAMFLAHWSKGLTGPGGMELSLLWATVLIYFLVHGGGRFSVDRVLGREV